MLIERVEKAIIQAENNITKLSEEVMAISGSSGRKIQILLNELCSYERVKYLEIGINDGKTFCSALYGNPAEGYGCDNWNNDRLKKFQQTANRYLTAGYTFFHQNCWEINISELTDINVYFFDGAHNIYDHQQAPIYFRKCMASQWIFLIDDWFTKCSDAKNNEQVCDITQETIEKSGIKILRKWELGSVKGWASDDKGYWNGLGIYVLSNSI